MAVPDATARNTRLDALSAAVTAWGTAQTTYLNNQVAFCQRILNNRPGAQQTSNATTTQATALTVDTLSQFLTGL
jgi:hypothetical protein